MKEQSFFVEDPIYNIVLYFVIGSHQYFMNQANKVFGLPFAERDSDGELSILHMQNADGETTKAFVLWINNDDLTTMQSILVHELGHFVISAFEYIGIKIDPQNQEPFTYYYQMIFDNIMKTLNKKTASRKKQSKA